MRFLFVSMVMYLCYHGYGFCCCGTEFLSILFDVNQYKHHHFIVLVLCIILRSCDGTCEMLLFFLYRVFILSCMKVVCMIHFYLMFMCNIFGGCIKTVYDGMDVLSSSMFMCVLKEFLD